jgi:hypothetical protein
MNQKNIPINDDLRDLGVSEFIRNGELVQIVIDKKKVVSFNIHPKEFVQTIERFKKSALNSNANLSEETATKIEHILVLPKNGYPNYLQPNNSAKSGSSNSDTDSDDPADVEDERIKTYATVYENHDALYETIIIEDRPYFLMKEPSDQKISIVEEIPGVLNN